MPNFAFTARNRSGRTITGTRQVDSEGVLAWNWPPRASSSSGPAPRPRAWRPRAE